MGDTIKVLAGRPEHTPLYYLMARFWVQWFGSDVAAIRSLSALISLLAFPCIYWLSKELFDASLVGLIAIALVAISPFHVLYAQEARQYSLWIVTILLSSAALLRAMRVKTKLSWGIYAATVSLGLYSHLFHALVAISHAIYVAVIERFRLSKTFIAYLISSALGALAFIPWVLVILTYLDRSNLQEATSWAYSHPSLSSLIKSWLISLSRIFFDLDRGWCFGLETSYCRYPLNLREPLLYLSLAFVILVGYSLDFLCKKTSQRAWLFILTLIGVTALAIALPDLVSGGQRSAMTRYFIPCLLGIQLTVAYCFAVQINSIAASIWQQKVWQFALVLLLSGGVLSCAVSSQSVAWWNKIHNYDTYSISHIINKAERPLLFYRFSDKFGTNGNYIMPIARLLEPKVQIQFLFQQKDIPQIPDNFSDVFIIQPNKTFRSNLNKQPNYTMKLVYDPRVELKPGFNMPTRSIWKIEKILKNN
ncbi:glycosyltransferase family 39 protein [Coleofasciculus sp. FACHB-1120]|uniref:glycosyltransferase family 39 protein n=1 Tax=Coleofasciculus sp. FACHB-1120 TaxID=2692783 RepID=UPI001F555984|nr:glycosyltransferase family 39 protein [Coleofasciculus sp. FACHB-1120]